MSAAAAGRPRARRIAVIGAGWAGLACALEASRGGCAVTLFEASRHVGGRARALPAEMPDGTPVTLDNGQHILIGAYESTLAAMRSVGLDTDALVERLPLSLRFPDGRGIELPAIAPWLDRATRRWLPLDVLGGILGARGWSWADKRSLLRTAAGWQRRGFDCGEHETVADLCAPLAERVRSELTEPLCVSALNTPAARASGRVFLRVMKDALFGPPGGSDLLLPRADLGALFPDAALRWLEARGVDRRLGQRVQSLAPEGDGWRVDGEAFDAVALACPSREAARLVAGVAPAWAACADALTHEGIATVYALAAGGLPAPLLALRDDATAPAQFVIDRGRLGGPAGLLAFVVSATEGDREAIEAQVLAQGRAQLGLPGLRPLTTVVERRATFACTPGLARPRTDVAPALLACGDYVDGPYPATLEGAVRHGTATGLALSRALMAPGVESG